ncbi:MAG: flagellar motor protein MotB, partial [Treponema sp.]|nr:flagellar motor protein MotB [Treponema sp.]
YADTRPKFEGDTEEAMAYNRRVDIVILDEGHF